MEAFNRVILSERLVQKSLQNYLGFADKEPSEKYVLMWGAEHWQNIKMKKSNVYQRCKSYHKFCVERYLKTL